MRIDKGLGVLAGVAALLVAAVAPASAEFFSCRDKPGQLLYSYNGSPDSYRSHGRGYRSYGSASSDGYSARARYDRAGSSRATNFRPGRSWHDRPQW